MKTKVTQPTEKMLLCGKRVAECRKEMGYSQEQLIEEIIALPENNGKPRNEKQISYIESGSRTLSIEYAHLIAKVLHVNNYNSTFFDKSKPHLHSKRAGTFYSSSPLL